MKNRSNSVFSIDFSYAIHGRDLVWPKAKALVILWNIMNVFFIIIVQNLENT